MAPAKRRRWGRRIAYAAGAALIIGGGGFVLGPGAPGVVDQMADGRRVWRLGTIDIEGVSGSWLGALRAEHITLSDDEGVWFEARDVALNWRPQDILFGRVWIDAAQASAVNLLRQPTLAEPRPSSGAHFDVHIGALSLALVDFAEPVLGATAQFTAEGAFDLRGADLRQLDLTLRRLDSDPDHAFITYRPDGEYVLRADVASTPGGIIARALGVSEQGLAATAEGEGGVDIGAVRYDAYIGDAQLLVGEAQWTPQRWSLNANAQLDLLPALQTLTRRIGNRARITASGARVGAFEIEAETPLLTVNLAGEANQERELQGSSRIVATATRLSDIARESPFALGAARFEGELRRARGATAVRGALRVEAIEALGRTVTLAGPVEAALSTPRFRLNADLRAADQPPALFANARLRTELSYDRGRGRFALDTATLEGDALGFSARGWSTGGDGEFSGAWRVRQLQAVSADLTGGAGGEWRARASNGEGARLWTITIAGQGARIAGEPSVVAQLLGATPTLDAMLRYEDGGITVSHARVRGARLRAGATGRIVGGESNLALEASAQGPLDLGGAQIDGVIDATGRVTGRIARPTLSAHASMASFNAGGALLAQPQLTFTLSPNGGGYAGRAELEGDLNGQPVTAQSNVAFSEGAVALRELNAQLAGLSAAGEASVTGRGVTAQLEVSGAVDGLVPGVRGRLVGDLALTPETLALDAHISDARAGELYVRAATLRASGPLNAIAANFELRGRLRRAPLAFTGAALLDTRAGDVQIDGRGALADAEIFTRAPITASWGRGQIDAALNVAVGDGVVVASWRERGRALSGSAQIEDAPIGPLAAIWGERATGRIDGRVSLASQGRGLAGEADLQLDDARFAGRQRGTLDMRVAGALEPTRMRVTIDARSTEGLVANFAADAPVVTAADPIRIALAPERRGEATWTVRGPAQSLWAATRLQDQMLEGQLDGEGRLQFGAGYLSGAGHIEIAEGRFEDKLTGVTFTALNARLAIDDSGVRIERFDASGPRGGRITATGGSANPREGRIDVTLSDIYVADRPEARARAGGQLALAWQGMNATLSGEINIIEANLEIASNPEAGIPTIDVIEINRPGFEDENGDEDEVPRRASATTLDVRVRAPGRVFTRGRGLDAEWSLDLRLTGSAANPQVLGTARAVRGTLALSGQPFSIEDARIVFSGDPLDARIDLTAVRDTADLTAYLHLTGTARRPEVSFTSDPALPEDEILPQILFGRSIEDLSPFEAAQLAASLATLSGRSSLDLVDAARAATGLDRFAVRQDEGGGFLVAGGVYLTRDVYLEVARTGLGEAQTRVEWTVRPRLVLITSFRGSGEQNVSLRWRRETD